MTEIGSTLLAQAKMPLKYWWDSFQTVAYVINRMPQNENPFETFYEKDFDYKSLKVF